MKQNTKAQILQELADKHGQLTPEIVVDEAKQKNHPLHKSFEWNNSKAAHQYRLVQASLLIRSVKVRVRTSNEKEVKVRAYVNVRDESETDEEPTPAKGYYVPVTEAMRVESYRDQVLKTAFRELAAFRNKYSNLSELESVIESIEEVLPAEMQA
jgi:hypothetical protein